MITAVEPLFAPAPALPTECEEVYSVGVAQDNRFDGLNKRVGEIEQKLLPQKVEVAPKKADNWLKRNTYWLTPLIAIVGLTSGTGVVIRFLTLTVDERIDGKLAEPNKQLRQLQLDVKGVSTRIDTFIELEKDRLKKIGDLKPPQFQRALPELRDAIQDAAALKVSISPAVHSAIQNNLLAASTREPGYWPTVAQYITYRSENQPDPSPFLLLLRLEKDMRCYNRLPKAESYPPPAGPFSYSGCVVDLGDHPDEQLSIFIGNLSKKGPDKHFIFSDCVVKYSGERPINPMLAGAVFHNCFYVFSVNAVPPLFEQRLIRAVLESQGSTVKFPS